MEAKDLDAPWEEWRGDILTATEEIHAALVEALKALLNHVDRETCRHEATHRGGAIWTICDDCGREWADDRGGFVPYTDPAAVAEARAALALAGETP
jgi:ribosomal protein L37AE/L43A